MAKAVKNVSPQADPQSTRNKFVELLQRGRRHIAAQSRPDGRAGDASHKGMAAKFKISPGRVGDFLSPQFSIEIAAPQKGARGQESKTLFEQPKVRKAIAGFAASVERVRSWLERENLLIDDEQQLTTEMIVEAYWPNVGGFDEQSVRAAIREGVRVAQAEAAQVGKINVELWIVRWGPFGEPGRSDQNGGFFAAYGSDLARAIDPIHATVKVQTKSLAQILDLPARERSGVLTIGMGPFETLHRRLRGLQFVSFPLVQFPIACLSISNPRARGPNPLQTFSDLISRRWRDGDVRFAYVEDDVGHLVLLSLLPEGDRARHGAVKISSEAQEAAKQLVGLLSERQHVVFMSDGMLTFELYNALHRAGIEVEALGEAPPEPAFSFNLGIMLRKEDSEVAELLADAQRQILRSYSRVELHLERLFDGIEAWVNRLKPSDQTLARWSSSNAPVFLIQRERLKVSLEAALSSSPKAEEVTEEILKFVRQKRQESEILKNFLTIYNSGAV